jgi:hypothetical protein
MRIKEEASSLVWKKIIALGFHIPKLSYKEMFFNERPKNIY